MNDNPVRALIDALGEVWCTIFVAWPLWAYRMCHRLYARLRGYFWLACPLCGTEFGGHQWRTSEDLPGDIWLEKGERWRGHAICPRCRKAGLGEK